MSQSQPPPSSPPSPTLRNPSPHHPLFSSEKGSPLECYPTLGHLVPAGLGTFSPTEAQPGSPSGGGGGDGGGGRGSSGRERRPR